MARSAQPFGRRVAKDAALGPVPGTFLPSIDSAGCDMSVRSGVTMEATMNSLIYLVGLVVVVLFILSFLGLR
jgi:hypothetical protein